MVYVWLSTVKINSLLFSWDSVVGLWISCLQTTQSPLKTVRLVYLITDRIEIWCDPIAHLVSTTEASTQDILSTSKKTGRFSLSTTWDLCTIRTCPPHRPRHRTTPQPCGPQRGLAIHDRGRRLISNWIHKDTRHTSFDSAQRIHDQLHLSLHKEKEHLDPLHTAPTSTATDPSS